MTYYFDALRRYATFSGRARRAEFWYFFLFDNIVGVAFAAVGHFAGADYLNLIYGVFSMLPSLAVTVRRLHDTGRRGWWCFIGLIPLIGTIIMLVFLVRDSEPGSNRFGENPKGNLSLAYSQYAA